MTIHLNDFCQSAQWQSSQLMNDGSARDHNNITYNGSQTDPRGFVRLGETTLEDGTRAESLMMHPKWVSQGTIKGWFPWIRIPRNARFICDVGFAARTGRTDGVTFQVIEHRITNGRQTWRRIANHSKLPNSRLDSIEIDFGYLGGETAGLELRVDSGPSASRDWAVWVDPRIEGDELPLNPTRLRLLHYNVNFLRIGSWLANRRGHWPPTDERAEAIGAAIAEYDILGLNEVFRPSPTIIIPRSAEYHAARESGAAQLPGAKVFDQTVGVPKGRITSKNSGLMCLSRLLITHVDLHEYAHQSGADKLANKGIIHAKLIRDFISPRSDYLDVYITHMQDGDVDVSREQVNELTRFIDSTSGNGPAILMGDMNIEGPTRERRTINEEYRLLRAVLERRGFSDLWPADRRNGATNPGNNRRIDHFWMRSSGLLECNGRREAELRVREMIDPNGVGKDGRLSDHRALEATITWNRPAPMAIPSRSDFNRVAVSVTRLIATTSDAGNHITDFYGGVQLREGVTLVSPVGVVTEGNDISPTNILDVRRYRRDASPRARIWIKDEDGFLRGGPDDDVDVNPHSVDAALEIEIDQSRGLVYLVNDSGERDLRLGHVGTPIISAGNLGETAIMTFMVNITPD